MIGTRVPDAWDPRQYERFRAERWTPFVDLAALVEPRPGLRIVDLGCGTGETTRWLHDTLGAAATLGIDRSRAMLARAAEAPGLRFAHGAIEDFADRGAWDLVFSNAALHWIGDHPALFARLAAALAEDGQLAVQMPANFDGLEHVAAAETAAEAPFREHLGDVPALGGHVLAPEAYATLLARMGFRTQHVRLQVYAHWLAAREDVVEWTKGSLLAAYRERLPPALHDAFLARYRARLLPRLADARPFFFPFKRLLLWGRR